MVPRSAAHPTPYQAPHIGSSQMLPVARHRAVKPAPTGPISTAARSASGVPPYQGEHRTHGEPQVAGGGEPGGGYVHVHDAHRVALLPVGGGKEQAPDQADRRGTPRRRPPAMAAPRRRDAKSAPGMANRCRERPGFRSLGGGATTELASTWSAYPMPAAV